MQPLHPDKPEPPIERNAVWIKKASGKTSKNAPTCLVVFYQPAWKGTEVTIKVSGKLRRHSERVFRRDWRPC
jgi:deoxyribose-phosphate aldolase